jgi:hypothetical protein
MQPRRELPEGSLTSFVAVSFLDTLSGFGLVPAAAAPVLSEWLRSRPTP